MKERYKLLAIAIIYLFPILCCTAFSILISEQSIEYEVQSVNFVHMITYQIRPTMLYGLWINVPWSFAVTMFLFTTPPKEATPKGKHWKAYKK